MLPFVHQSVAVARRVYIAQRVTEMLNDPIEVCRVISEAYCIHPGQTGHALMGIMRERPGALADLLTLMEHASETLANAEWHQRDRIEVAA